MKNWLPFFFIMLLLVNTSCDLEKFLGYDYSAAPIPDAARLYGSIVDQYTGQPVAKARIGIASQFTYTDDTGDFVMYYHLGEDDERNKPVTVYISADNYMPLDTNMIIFPENQLNKRLVYGAPIIRRIARVDSICQAEIFDYQGAEDISSVTGSFTYVLDPMSRKVTLYRDISMVRVAVDTPNTAFYQGIIDTFVPGYGYLQPTYFVEAVDKGMHLVVTSNSAVGQDSLIFPVVQ